jgi:hypothetical protein
MVDVSSNSCNIDIGLRKKQQRTNTEDHIGNKKIEEKKTCIPSELISDLICCTVQVN